MRAFREMMQLVAMLTLLTACASGAGPPPHVAPKMWLVSVGVSRYKSKALRLEDADDDAQAIYEVLWQTSGTDPERRLLLTNRHAKRGAVLDALRDFGRRAAVSDVVIVFASMHSMQGSGDTFYLLAHDSDPRQLWRTGISDDDLVAALRPAKHVVLLLDLCHQLDNYHPGIDAPSCASWEFYARLARRGVGVLAATSDREHSQAAAGAAGHGLFADRLIKGLDGAADSEPKDGVITLRELYDFIYPSVRADTSDRQHPNILGDDKVPVWCSAQKGCGPRVEHIRSEWSERSECVNDSSRPPLDRETFARVRQLLTRGNEKFDHGHLREAEALYLEAWNIHHSFDIAGNLGELEAALKKARDALKYFECAISTFPLGGRPQTLDQLLIRRADMKRLLGEQ